jgi:hypothetical protein
MINRKEQSNNPYKQNDMITNIVVMYLIGCIIACIIMTSKYMIKEVIDTGVANPFNPIAICRICSILSWAIPIAVLVAILLDIWMAIREVVRYRILGKQIQKYTLLNNTMTQAKENIEQLWDEGVIGLNIQVNITKIVSEKEEENKVTRDIV